MATAPAPAAAPAPAEGGGGDVGELVTNVLGALDVLSQLIASSQAPDELKQQFATSVTGLQSAVDGLFGGGGEMAENAMPAEAAGSAGATPVSPATGPRRG